MVKPLTLFAKNSIADVRLSSKQCTSGVQNLTILQTGFYFMPWRKIFRKKQKWVSILKVFPVKPALLEDMFYPYDFISG